MDELDYNFYRYYSPELGRYLRSDPAGLGGGINDFSYVNQNSLKYSDIFGLCICNNIEFKRKYPYSNIDGDPYGHWWVEMGEESYGWYPDRLVTYTEAIIGVPGELNGITAFKGEATRDHHHGLSSDDFFNPQIYAPETCGLLCDDQCKDAENCIRNFAISYTGNWRVPDQSCWSFQIQMMVACNLSVPGNSPTNICPQPQQNVTIQP